MTTTPKEMCEVIAEAKMLVFKGTDRHPTAREIWDNYGSQDFSNLTSWFMKALVIKGDEESIAKVKEMISNFQKSIEELK